MSASSTCVSIGHMNVPGWLGGLGLAEQTGISDNLFYIIVVCHERRILEDFFSSFTFLKKFKVAHEDFTT